MWLLFLSFWPLFFECVSLFRAFHLLSFFTASAFILSYYSSSSHCQVFNTDVYLLMVVNGLWMELG
jgi:hypothetical protein